MSFANQLVYAEQRALESNGIEFVGLMVHGGKSRKVRTFRNENGSLGTIKTFDHKESDTSKPHGVTIWFEFADGSTVDIIEHFIK